VPVKNDAVRLRRCLESLRLAAAGQNTELIVADNGSTDDSRRVAEAAGASVLHLPGLKVGELRNEAARHSAAPVLAFVDSDHEVRPGWAAAALELFAAEPSIGGVGAPYDSPADGTWVQRMYDALRGNVRGRRDVQWLGSGNLAVRRDAFLALGGFDGRLEACEDVDLCQRLRAAGFRIVADERLGSIHHGDPPTLRRLLVSELWRGRDNLRVSLRGPLSARSLPSIVFPILQLAALLALPAALVGMPWLGTAPTAVAAASLLVPTLLRTAGMLANHRRVSPLVLPQALAVALTYDAARALALVFRARHHRARQAA
jgi:hypothetical protein